MKRIGYVQFTPTLGEIEANRDRIAGLLEGLEADLLVLPELPFTGYALADRETARSLSEVPEDSPSVDGLAAACRSGGFSCPFFPGYSRFGNMALTNAREKLE